VKAATYSALSIAGVALSLSLLVPENVDEFDALAKKPGACLASGIANEIYRGVLADFRAEFCDEFEAELAKEFPDATELKRKTKASGRKKKVEGGAEEDILTYAEAELEYVRRALAVLAGLRGVGEVPITEFQPVADRVLAKTEEIEVDGVKVAVPLIRFDPSRAERGERGPKTVPKVYQKAAENIIAAGKRDAFIEKHGVTITMPENADEAKQAEVYKDAIARKIQALEEAERAKIDLTNKYV
jgi:hypothetical protein